MNLYRIMDRSPQAVAVVNQNFKIVYQAMGKPLPYQVGKLEKDYVHALNILFEEIFREKGSGVPYELPNMTDLEIPAINRLFTEVEQLF